MVKIFIIIYLYCLNSKIYGGAKTSTNPVRPKLAVSRVLVYVEKISLRGVNYIHFIF